MIDLKRILLPTDFSKYSRAAVAYAAAFADKFGAEIHILHVAQNVAVFLPDMVNVMPPVMPTMDQLTGPIKEAMQKLIAEEQLERFTVHQEIREGTPFHEIIQIAKDKNIDLIIMGTHGHTGLAHVLLGSVSEKVVRKSPCPVLTVRHPEHEFVHPE